MVTPTPQNLVFDVLVSTGFAPNLFQTLFLYNEPDTSQVTYSGVTPVTIPAHSQSFAINPAAIFPATDTFKVFGMAEVTQPGVQLAISQAMGGPRLPWAAGGFSVHKLNGLPPIFWIDNPNSSDANILVFMTGAARGTGWRPTGVVNFVSTSQPLIAGNQYYVINLTGNITLTLPDATLYPGQNIYVFVETANGFTVQFATTSGQTINGSSPTGFNTSTNNTAFSFNSDSLNWVSPAVGSGGGGTFGGFGGFTNVFHKTTSFTAAGGNVYFVDATSGPLTVTLDNAQLYPGEEVLIFIKTTGGNNVTFATTGGQQINGQASGYYVTNTPMTYWRFVSAWGDTDNDSNWYFAPPSV